jgi:hypothetical protein
LFVTNTDLENIEQLFRDLLLQGQSLEEAVRTLHVGNGLGLMWLWPAVSAVSGMNKPEAMRLVVRATFDTHRGD